MEARTIQFFADACGGQWLGSDPSRVVRSVSTDSRAIQAGDLFVALRGDRFDGHEFLEGVWKAGAVGAVVEQPKVPGGDVIVVQNTRTALGQIGAKYREAFKLPVVAVAGSNGKTSTKELLAAVLGQKLETLSSQASFNNDIGVPLTLLRLEAKHQAGVFEVGTNHPGELRPLLEMIQPQIGIITSIGREHLEFFGDLQGVLQEEGTVAEVLPPDGTLLIHGDGFGAQQLAERSRAQVIRVGEGEKNDWRLRNITVTPEGTNFQLTAPDPAFSGEYTTKLLGRHQALNAAYAIVVGRNLGLSRAEIQRGLSLCLGAKMRMQAREVEGVTIIDDAYNANADSVAAALETLSAFPCKGRRLAVLGEMAELGESSALAHEEAGKRAARAGVHCLMAVGKSAAITGNAARAEGMAQVLQIEQVEDAGKALAELVQPGDVVLFKASRSTRLERVIEFLTTHLNPGKLASVY